MSQFIFLEGAASEEGRNSSKGKDAVNPAGNTAVVEM